MAGLILALAPLTQADVGLPSYQGPNYQQSSHQEPSYWAETRQAPSPASRPLVVKPISHGDNGAELREEQVRPLSCAEATRQQGTALDFAPPADKRADADSTRMTAIESLEDGTSIPIYVAGTRAALKTGTVVNTLEAVTIDGRMVLVSKNKDYFNRLQAIRPKDKLLVQTAESLRQYEVTHTRIAHAGAGAEESSDGLTLAACYPFQPIGSASLLYVVSAQPYPAAGPFLHTVNQGGGTYETVNF